MERIREQRAIAGINEIAGLSFRFARYPGANRKNWAIWSEIATNRQPRLLLTPHVENSGVAPANSTAHFMLPTVALTAEKGAPAANSHRV
jgi:hypothetical protein